MNYDLAKELKDAGFPQIESEAPTGIGDGKGNACRLPTLSELIEACGDSFHALGHIGKEWQAVANNGLMRNEAKTPEEAVARLWLVLNKHD